MITFKVQLLCGHFIHIVILSMQGFEIYEEEYVLLREKVPELDEWDKVPVSTVIIGPP